MQLLLGNDRDILRQPRINIVPGSHDGRRLQRLQHAPEPDSRERRIDGNIEISAVYNGEKCQKVRHVMAKQHTDGRIDS